MKKLFAVLMAMAMVVSMAACAAPAETEAAPSADVEMKYMTADETEAVLGNTDYVIVDVRKAADYAEGHIPGSVSVDMDAAVNGDTAAGEAAMKAAFDGKDSTLILRQEVRSGLHQRPVRHRLRHEQGIHTPGWLQQLEGS